MERQNSGKVLSIVAIVLAIAGLSLGFAAFSTTLDIESTAEVPVDASVWKVGFSNANSGIPSDTVVVNGVTNSANNGSVNLTQYTIAQNSNAELATEDGSQVEYDFYIVNEGSLDAYLNTVSMGTLSCAYDSGATGGSVDEHTTVTAGTGTISDADCALLFTATLTLNNSSTYTSGSSAVTSGFGNTNKLSKPTNNTPTYIPAKLTIAYNTNGLNSVSNVPNGDFLVTLSDSTVVYGTSSN